MNYFLLMQSLSTALSKDSGVNKVYDLRTHQTRLSNIEKYEDFSKIRWETIRKNFIELLGIVYKYIANTLYDTANADVHDAIFDLHDNIDLIIPSNDEEKELLFKTYILLLFYSVTSRREDDDLVINNSDASKKKTLYRGVSEYDLDLIPSIIWKNDKYYTKRVEIIDKSKIEEIYRKENIISKYKNIFKTDVIDYNHLAYIQHAISNSPFLDFTESQIVALSFASFSTTKKTDGCLYECSTKDIGEASKFDPNDLFIVYVKDKLKFLDKIGTKDICYCTIKDFEVNFSFYMDRTNDRMKYQQGAFLLFTHCVIVGKQMLLPITALNIKKYRIPNKKVYSTKTFSKGKIRYLIRKSYPQYTYKRMMNPYDYFK